MAAKKARYELPSEIQVGPFPYKVAPLDHTIATNLGFLGECNRTTDTIRISDGMSPQRTAAVFLHEIFHALYEAHGLLNENFDEERIVDSLSYAFAQFVKDNPGVTKDLFEALR